MRAPRPLPSRTLGALVLAAAAVAVLTLAGARVSAQDELPSLHHAGYHFWQESSQATAIERLRKALVDAGLTLDPGDEVGAKWVAVGRKPGLYAGVSAVADGDTNDLVGEQATRVLVSITVVSLPELAAEANALSDRLDQYARTGRAAGEGAEGEERIWTSKDTYTFPEDVVVHWAGTPGDETDNWSIAPAEPVEWGPGQYLVAGATQGRKDGEAVVGAAYNGLHSGRFVVRLFHAGGREPVLKHYFRVVREQ